MSYSELGPRKFSILYRLACSVAVAALAMLVVAVFVAFAEGQPAPGPFTKLVVHTAALVSLLSALLGLFDMVAAYLGGRSDD